MAPGPLELQSLRDLAVLAARPAQPAARAVGRFAGQGHRYVEELQELRARSPAVRELLEAVASDLRVAAELLGVAEEPLEPARLLQLLGSGPEEAERLVRPSASCPMIGLAQLATAWQAVEESGLGGLWHVRSALAAGLAGHSQGVISAVALASARSRTGLQAAISTAVRLLWLIGRHAEAVEGGMALLDGPGLGRRSLEAAAGGIPDLCIVGRNLQHTYVLAGTLAALESLAEGLEAGSLPGLEKCRLKRLRIAAPFHCPLMAEVVPRVVADACRLGLSFAPLTLPVYGGSGQRLDASPSLEELVGLVCSEEINWPATMAAVGPHAFVIEFGPGASLPLAEVPRLAALSQQAAQAGDGVISSVALSKVHPQSGVRLELLAARMCVLQALAATIGCTQDEIDYEVPFFDMGLRSSDLPRFAGALAEAMGGEAIPAHELFDHPTVEQLANRLARPGGAGGAASPHSLEGEEAPGAQDVEACVAWHVARALGCRDVAELERDVPLHHLGLSAQEQAQVAASLAARLGLQVGLQDLLDFPTARRLARRLRQRLAAVANLGPAWAVVEPEEWASPGRSGGGGEPVVLDRSRRLDVAAVLEVQQKLCGHFAQQAVRRELQELQEACFPDGASYLAALQARVGEEQLKACQALGYGGMDMAILREQAMRVTVDHMRRVPRLRELSHKLVLLTWPSDPDRWRW